MLAHRDGLGLGGPLLGHRGVDGDRFGRLPRSAAEQSPTGALRAAGCAPYGRFAVRGHLLSGDEHTLGDSVLEGVTAFVYSAVAGFSAPLEVREEVVPRSGCQRPRTMSGPGPLPGAPATCDTRFRREAGEWGR